MYQLDIRRQQLLASLEYTASSTFSASHEWVTNGSADILATTAAANSTDPAATLQHAQISIVGKGVPGCHPGIWGHPGYHFGNQMDTPFWEPQERESFQTGSGHILEHPIDPAKNFMPQLQVPGEFEDFGYTATVSHHPYIMNFWAQK